MIEKTRMNMAKTLKEKFKSNEVKLQYVRSNKKGWKWSFSVHSTIEDNVNDFSSFLLSFEMKKAIADKTISNVTAEIGGFVTNCWFWVWTLIFC